MIWWKKKKGMEWVGWKQSSIKKGSEISSYIVTHTHAIIWYNVNMPHKNLPKKKVQVPSVFVRSSFFGSLLSELFLLRCIMRKKIRDSLRSLGV
jgi:hypothetical protein